MGWSRLPGPTHPLSSAAARPQELSKDQYEAGTVEVGFAALGFGESANHTLALQPADRTLTRWLRLRIQLTYDDRRTPGSFRASTWIWWWRNGVFLGTSFENSLPNAKARERHLGHTVPDGGETRVSLNGTPHTPQPRRARRRPRRR